MQCGGVLQLIRQPPPQGEAGFLLTQEPTRVADDSERRLQELVRQPPPRGEAGFLLSQTTSEATAFL